MSKLIIAPNGQRRGLVWTVWRGEDVIKSFRFRWQARLYIYREKRRCCTCHESSTPDTVKYTMKLNRERRRLAHDYLCSGISPVNGDENLAGFCLRIADDLLNQTGGYR